MDTPGEIRSDSVYALPEFLRRTGWGQWAWRKAKQGGLKWVRRGNTVFVSGADAVAYLTGKPETPANAG